MEPRRESHLLQGRFGGTTAWEFQSKGPTSTTTKHPKLLQLMERFATPPYVGCIFFHSSRPSDGIWWPKFPTEPGLAMPLRYEVRGDIISGLGAYKRAVTDYQSAMKLGAEVKEKATCHQETTGSVAGFQNLTSFVDVSDGFLLRGKNMEKFAQKLTLESRLKKHSWSPWSWISWPVWRITVRKGENTLVNLLVLFLGHSFHPFSPKVAKAEAAMQEKTAEKSEKVPVTVLTGFLGSGHLAFFLVGEGWHGWAMDGENITEVNGMCWQDLECFCFLAWMTEWRWTPCLETILMYK